MNQDNCFDSNFTQVMKIEEAVPAEILKRHARSSSRSPRRSLIKVSNSSCSSVSFLGGPRLKEPVSSHG